MAYQQLTQDDVDHFLKHGWIKLSNCFTQQQVNELAGTLWTRLGMDPNDKSTWVSEHMWEGRTNLPKHHTFDASSFAPKAWAAICDLVGGEDRIADYNRTWNDGFIVNLGTSEMAGKNVSGQDLNGWHVDGDFFVHYLDSPEQGLLVIPLFTDIRVGGGGTMICPDGIPKIAEHLHNHPDGVSPMMVPRAEDPEFGRPNNLEFFSKIAKSMPDESFVEVTGKVGDVYLLHPLMLHSHSNNKLRDLRVITNPPISLKDPFFSQSGDLSVVEQKTLAALGQEKLGDWRITNKRDQLVPARLKRQAKMMEEELARLAELKAKSGSGISSNSTQGNVVASA